MVTTTWTKEAVIGDPSIWAYDTLPWLLPLPWQYGLNATVWTKEY